MLWALLARFLLSKPAWVQATALGLCTGLFATTAAEASERDPVITATILMVLIWGAGAGALFYVGFVVQSRHGALTERSAPPWLYTVYGAVWLLGLAAAALALFGDGGLKVAVLAVVPLVLLAPPAFHGMRQITHRMVS